MKKWIITIGGSNADGVQAYTYTGTDKQVKAELVRFIKLLVNSECFEDAADYTKTVGAVQAHDYQGSRGSYYAYAVFDTYHVDVEAIPADAIEPWKLS